MSSNALLPTPVAAYSDQHVTWASLPPNVLIRVFLQLTLKELCCCSAVCSSWRATASADRLWQGLLHAHFHCKGPTPHSTSCRQCLMQLTTSTLWSCGSTWPSITATIADSRATELVKLWSNTPTSGTATLPLPRYCQLPDGYAVTEIAAGRSHLALLSCSGKVIDTRAEPAPPALIAATAAVHAPAGHQPAEQTLAGQQPAAHQPHLAAAHAALPPYELPAAAVQLELELNVAPNDPLAVWLAEDAAHNHAAAVGQDIEQAQEAEDGQTAQQFGLLKMVNLWQPFGAAVCTIAAGSGHVLAVTSCGQVWGWGNNEYGQLGLGHSRSWVAAPTQITAVLEGAWKADSDVICSAACGDLHSALLASSGAVYTAGCNKQGQCAQGKELQLCTVFCQPSSTSSSPILAAAVACGTANTAIASTSGRLLVCGDASSGQCGASYIKPRCCYEFVDVGPELGWHGLNRPTAAQLEAVGGHLAQALPKVVKVAVGCGTCYALTNEGELYAWGAGSKGQLGRGGCAKVQATPAKLPWARRITQVSASLDGQFAAAVDAAGHLYTWGAGKWGQLGHGDTSKRTVGRAVKQLKHQQVLQAVCGSESLLVLTCHRPHQQHQQQQHESHLPASNTKRQQSAASSADRTRTAAGSSRSLVNRASRGSSSTAAADVEVDADLSSSAAALGDMGSADWVDVEGEGPFYTPSPRTARRGSRAAKKEPGTLGDLTGDCSDGNNDSHALASAADERHHQLSGPLDMPTSSSSSSCAANSKRKQQNKGPQQRRLSSAMSPHTSRVGIQNMSPSYTTADEAGTTAAAAAAAEVQEGQQCDAALRLEHAHGLGDNAMSEGSSESSLPQPARHPKMDKGFRRLLKRLLKSFVSDNRQRELTFPGTLSSCDRYYIHVAAEAWGLGHASHNEGDERVIKVWKMSRSRRMHSGADPSFGSD